MRIVWYGRADAREAPTQGAQIHFSAPGEFCDSTFEAAVLDRRAFDELEAMFELRDELPMPALLVVEREELQPCLARIREGDDVTLAGTAPELVAWRLEQLVRRAADLRDGLTRLGVKRAFTARLEAALESTSERAPLSVLMVDIDHFKSVNDEHGHQEGDQVLKELAQRVLTSCSLKAFAARYSGDKISILLPGGENEAIALAELLRDATRQRPFAGGIPVTVSLGAATARAPIPVRDLLREVDEAVYASKAAGRDRVTHYSELEREAIRSDGDIDLFAFENLTRVIADRVANVITRRGRRLFREMRQQADVDSLTGLYSRRYLDRRLAFEFEETRRSRRALTVALIDIDFFGQVNKQHGWPSGDHVLTDLAQLVTDGVRGGDWVARYGGEEFCLVMPGTPLEVGRKVMERVREAIEEHTFASEKGAELHVTVSIGGVEARDTDADVLALFERVSDQLLAAKRGGRNQVCS